MRNFHIFFFLLGFISLNAQQYSRVQMTVPEGGMEELIRLGLEIDHGSWVGNKYFTTDLSEGELQIIHDSGVKYKIVIEDVISHYADQLSSELNLRSDHCEEESSMEIVTPDNFTLGNMGGFYTYEHLLEILDSMRRMFPELISVKDTIPGIQTHEGRPIYYVKISDNVDEDEDEEEVLYTALHHAREPNGLSQMIFFMWHVLEEYPNDQRVQYLLNNLELYFIPCINPDGYLYNQQIEPNGGGLWRKNRRDNMNNSFGVDLNRNYGYKWGLNDDGSSPEPNSGVYRGPEPFSEPETQAVRYMCNQHEFRICLNYHTFGNLLIYPFGFTDSLPGDIETFRAFGEIMAQDNDYFAGTAIETVGYTVNGDSDDWMYAEEDEKPKIYAMTPEVGDGNYGFWPPSSEITRLSSECLEMNLVTAELALDYTEVIPSEGVYIDDFNNYLNFEYRKGGLQTSDIAIGLISESEWVDFIAAEKILTLAHLHSGLDSFQYIMKPNTPLGEEIEFVLTADNGMYQRRDTINLIFGDPQYETIFIDSIQNGILWEGQDITQEWKPTTEEFVSPVTSMTDSPLDDYENNEFIFTQLIEPIEIQDGLEARLKFYAKWEIEPAYDYTQVMISTDGENFTALCGKYTKVGGSNQIPEHLYDGFQTEWVEEDIDISDYLGQDVWIRFQLVSDQGLREDGFYFDDIRIEVLKQISVASKDLDVTAFTIFPNPTEGEIVIQSEETFDRIYLQDVSGKSLLERESSEKRLNIPFSIPAGIYWVLLEKEGSLIGREKLILIR